MLAIYQRKYDALDLQRARFGAGRVPSEVALDIQDTEESIKRIKAKLLAVSIPKEVVDATGPESGIDVLREHVKQLGDQINTAMRLWTAEIIGMRETTMQYRAEQEAKHRAGRRIQLTLLAIDVALFVFVLWRLG